MTVRILTPWNGYPAGAIVTLDAATETALVNNIPAIATFNTSGGFQWAPNSPYEAYLGGLSPVQWAGRPSPASVPLGQALFVSDVGPSGSYWTSTPTAWIPANDAITLYSSAVPIIVLSSGTFANTTGSMTGLATLPYVPVGVVRVWVWAGAGIPASGLYFATFSSATACQLWLDAAGTITPTGITAGPYAGGTSEALIPLVTVPGGLLGANGGLRVWLRYSSALNNANVKTCVLRLGATSVALLPNLASLLNQRAVVEITNRGSQAVQLNAQGSSAHTQFAGSSAALQQSTVDTSVDRVLGFGATVAAATDSIIVESCAVELIGG